LDFSTWNLLSRLQNHQGFLKILRRNKLAEAEMNRLYSRLTGKIPDARRTTLLVIGFDPVVLVDRKELK
jgi:hypothetical protein